MHNLWTLFSQVADAVGERTAISWRGHTTTHAELRDRSVRLANVLRSYGCGFQTDRARLSPWESGQTLVGLYLLNTPEYLEASVGGYAARAAPFNINYRYVSNELVSLFDDSKLGALIYHSRFAHTVAEALQSTEEVPLLIQVDDESGAPLLPGAIDYEQALLGAEPTLADSSHDPDDLYILYTGGTTGAPKAALWRQADLWTGVLGGDRYRDPTVAEVVLTAQHGKPHRFLPNAPLMHGAAHWIALRTLIEGGAVVLNTASDRLDPCDVWRLVRQERIDSMLMIGDAMAMRLLEALEPGDDTSSLRLILSSGAPTSPRVKRMIRDAIPTAMVVDSAGASEMGIALRAIAKDKSIGEPSIFSPRPGTGVLSENRQRILDPSSEETGWLAKSGSIPLGYLNDPTKTRDTFPVIEGVRWSVPGDRARYRAGRAIELLGRDNLTINTGGEKVFTEEVEAALLRHPAIEDVVVVGVSSPRWGQEVVAIVSIHDCYEQVTDREIVDSASTQLAGYKLPKQLIRVEHVQRSATGKNDYAWARKTASSSLGGGV